MKEEVEGREGGAVNKEEMQQLRSSKVGWNLLWHCHCYYFIRLSYCLLATVGFDRLQDAALDRLDGLYQTMWRGDPGTFHECEEKS